MFVFNLCVLHTDIFFDKMQFVINTLLYDENRNCKKNKLIKSEISDTKLFFFECKEVLSVIV